MLPDIRVQWETYNVDLKDRPHVEESLRRRHAPSLEHAGSEAVSISDENIQDAPERNDSPQSEGTDASTRNVAVIMDETLHFRTLNLAVSNCCDTNTLLG